MAAYFNPQKTRAAAQDFGVALEGGGSKAAPFALGTLAGLYELGLLQEPAEHGVRAISSISGGSYAASYYYNRLFDRDEGAPDAGEPADWFRSCIPGLFISQQRFEELRPQAEPSSCREGDPDLDPDRAESGFANQYRFLGHVWTNHDLLRASSRGGLDTDEQLRFAEYGNLLLLGSETLVTVPFQLLARTVFRWPLNSAPSKLAYKLGIERQYGYTPQDWTAAGRSDLAHMIETLRRRRTRTLRHLAPLQCPGRAPLWIIGTTAPGAISGVQWLAASPRDPLRQQFELTATAYGSGIYGYAMQSPDAPFDFLGRNPEGLPIMDAVVASAAFFDDDQTQISRQPFRFLAGVGQHFLNVTWFTELRNFNVGTGPRLVAKVLPWPLYLTTLQQNAKTPYIHLQDGGNSENTGILPLLRRGYRTIIYAHGTQDSDARWEAICHLKNQLELDGSYFVRSPALESLVAEHGASVPATGGRRFASYLDALCSSELDASDLATFDDNPKRPWPERIPAVAKLYCGRLGDRVERRTEPDPNYPTCDEFALHFGREPANAGAKPAEPPADARDLFYRWPAGTAVSFQVYRGDTLAHLDGTPPATQLLSTILAIVPAISWPDVAGQLVPRADRALPKDWNGWCKLTRAERQEWRLAYCVGPDDRLLAQPGSSPAGGKALSCTALSHVLDDQCKGPEAARRPEFPQDDFVLQTLHTTYTSYAAYFDLARHQVRSVLCANWPAEAGAPPAGCAAEASERVMASGR